MLLTGLLIGSGILKEKTYLIEIDGDIVEKGFEENLGTSDYSYRSQGNHFASDSVLFETVYCGDESFGLCVHHSTQGPLLINYSIIIDSHAEGQAQT